MADELLTTGQAASRLGLSRVRVLALIREGRLPAERLGRVWVLRAADVEAFARQPRKPGYPKGRPRTRRKDKQPNPDQS